MSDDNLMNTSRLGALILVAGTVLGGFFLYNKITNVEKEIKNTEQNLLKKLTKQLVDQTNTVRDVISDRSD